MPSLAPLGEGIHIYEPKDRAWRRFEGGAREALREGVNVVYFRNLFCSYCKILDLKLPDIAEMYGACANIVVVTCGWFAKLCLDRYAKESFLDFRVSSSPTIYLIRVSGSSVISEHKYEGVPSLAELRSMLSRLGLMPCTRPGRHR